MQVTRDIVLESGTRVKVIRRDVPDGLWERIALLPEDDKILLELSLRVGASHRQIARALKRSPGTVSRAIRSLGRRLHDPLVVTLLHRDCPLDPVYRQVAVEHLLTGLTFRELSRKHELPQVQVRRIVQFVRAWHRGIGVRRGGARH